MADIDTLMLHYEAGKRDGREDAAKLWRLWAHQIIIELIDRSGKPMTDQEMRRALTSYIIGLETEYQAKQ